MKPNQSLRYRQDFFNPKYPSMRYKPVELGGWCNHYGFYLFYLSAVILCLFGVVACVANAERIDAWFSEVLKNIFL